MKPSLVFILACLAVISFHLAFASLGDRSPLFRSCVSRCNAYGYARAVSDGFQPIQVEMCGKRESIFLRLLQWSCKDDCAYHCMQAIERYRATLGHSHWKYFGKWPFLRIFGVQEPLSVLMSLGNFLSHVLGGYNFLQIRKQSKGANPFAKVWWLYTFVSCMSWIASALFHSRDLQFTERIDYLTAVAVVFCGSSVALIRIAGVSRLVNQIMVMMATGSFWALHMWYMMFVKFDYGWNMKLCIMLGITQGLGLVVWSQITKHPARATMLAFIALVNAAALFEVLDFPPVLGLADAHSVWHALTVVLTPLWYRFIRLDHLHILNLKAD